MAETMIHKVLIGVGILVVLTPSIRAAHRPPRNVPPTDEIELLDPNADPLGRPAVELQYSAHGLHVDIPPAVLVHKYYYTGDRSFQAQMLPGGPSIVVVNHPKTGERCYIPVQMLPGAPRVTYTGNAIEYDYGENGITVHFGLFGAPTIKYRSGLTWGAKMSNLVHAEQVRAKTQQMAAGSKAMASTSQTTLKVAAIHGSQLVKTVTLPVHNVLRVLPFGAAIFDPDRHTIWAEKVAEHQRQHEIEHAAKIQERNELTIRTNR